MLLRLVRGTHWVIQVRRRALLDVATENVRHHFAACKIHKTLIASDECVKVPDEHPPGIEAVAGKQNSSLTIIEGDAQRIVAWNRDDVDRPVSEVDLSGIVRPFPYAKKPLHASHVEGHHGHAFHPLELAVAGDVISVRMGVRHHQRNRFALVVLKPSRHHAHYRACGLWMS